MADLKLHICTYIQVKENKPAIFRLKKVYARDPTTEIKVDRGRYTKDEQDEELDKEELTDGFRYGTTFVPISKETLDDMKYRSEKCFSIIGFSDANNVSRTFDQHHAVNDISLLLIDFRCVEVFISVTHFTKSLLSRTIRSFSFVLR